MGVGRCQELGYPCGRRDLRARPRPLNQEEPRRHTCREPMQADRHGRFYDVRRNSTNELAYVDLLAYLGVRSSNFMSWLVTKDCPWLTIGCPFREGVDS